MKSQERLDKVLAAGAKRIQDEVSALLGKPFKLGEPQSGETDKEALFAEPGDKLVVSHIRIDGDVQGAGCLLVGIKDAIRIGGTLIMLPEAELESVLGERQYSEELQDSYGEVANIICGAVTVAFEELYPKSVRLIRTEQEMVLPTQVDIGSSQPIADIPYYQLSVPMLLDGKNLGNLQMVLPAEPFGLVDPGPQEQPGNRSESEADLKKQPPRTATATEKESVLARDGSGDEASGEADVLKPSEKEAVADGQDMPSTTRKRDVGKQKKLIDGLLKNSWARTNDEVSLLLGGTFKITPLENAAVTKEAFLEQAGSKLVMTRMELRGNTGNEAYLFVDLKSAVHLGGCLIMLPESELEETVRNESFGDDARDAYGEVTNIIAGVFTSVFEEQYRGKIGFVKTDIEPIAPLGIDPDSDEVFANRHYYLSLGQMHYNEQDLGRVQFLVPAQVFDLEDLFLTPEAPAAEAGAGKSVRRAPGGGRETEEAARLRGQPDASTDMLIVTDDDPEADRLAEILKDKGFTSRILHFKDPINAVLTPRIQMVFLVMREVGEQGFGVAIKISSSGLPVPLVAAGPAWTRTLVLKAVKYGACDILITPASSEDIREKLASNLVQKAA